MRTVSPILLIAFVFALPLIGDTQEEPVPQNTGIGAIRNGKTFSLRRIH
jgi:hypothetical protein